MENTENAMRTHVVSDTETQQTITIQSNATTLGELKRDLRAAGLKTDGKTISEGITGVEFKNDDSILPTEVTYKGKKRTGLVFRMTTENKKIESGAMTRDEVVNELKSRNLIGVVKDKTGRNYTNVSTAVLIEILEENATTVSAQDQKECCEECCEEYNVFEELDKAIDTLLNIKLTLIHAAADYYEEKVGYTKSEINEVLNRM